MTENNAAQPSIDLVIQMLGPLACLVQPPGSGSSQGFTIPCATVRMTLEPVIEMLSKLRAEGVQAGELPAYINDDSQPLQYRLGWNNCLSDCRAALASAPLADTLPLEKALYELVDKIAPGLDTGDLVQDARRSSTLLDAIMASAPVTGEAVSYQVRRTDGSPLACWETCTKDLYDETLATGRYNGLEGAPPCEVRALGVIDAAPQASEAVRNAIETCAKICDGRSASLGWKNPTASNEAHKCGMAIRSRAAGLLIQADRKGGDGVKGAGDVDKEQQ